MTNNLARGVDVDESTQTKACTKCGVEKPIDGFARDRSARDGHCYRCKDCVNEARRRHYEANVERENERARQWRAANPERHRELTDRWERENRERRAEARRLWRQENREQHLATRKAWLEANPDYYDRWNAANRELLRATLRRYRESHPDMGRKSTQARRARERQAACGPIDLDALWNGLCALCDDPMDETLAWPDPLSRSIDHITPLSRGGAHSQVNLQWAHLVCNLRKGDRLLDASSRT